MSYLLSFIISYNDKHVFSSRWKWIRCCNDVMNHVDCVIKRDIYQQKKHSCSKNIRGISVFVLKISVVYEKDMSWVILHGYSRGYGRPLLQAWLLLDLDTIPDSCVGKNSLELSSYGIGFWCMRSLVRILSRPYISAMHLFICFFVTE